MAANDATMYAANQAANANRTAGIFGGLGSLVGSGIGAFAGIILNQSEANNYETRRQYFSGNYGSALGSTANAAKLIAQAGATQGQMFANMGNQIGGAIEKYQLNKEKQKKNEGFIKSQSGMLDMLAEQDPEMASQYSAMKEQLNNPDVPLATRAEFGKNLVNNITLSSQLKGQRLLQDTQAQTLEEQERTAKLREDLLQQKSDLNKIVNDIKSIDLANLETLSPLQREETLARLRSSINLIPSEEASKKATNELTAETAQASKKLLPLQTADKEGEFAARSTQRKIDDEVIDQLGGVQGAASKRVKDSNLASANIQSQIDYRNNVGLAQLYKFIAEKNPTFAEQFNPLAALQDKLRAVTVKTPKGESVTYAEYEKLHNEDPELYPMNNEPGAIRGQIESVNSQIYNLSREQLVPVDVPDNLSQDGMVTPTENNITNNIDSQTAQLMAGPGALTQTQRTITDPAAIAVLKRGGTFRGKTLQQLIDEGVIIQGL